MPFSKTIARQLAQAASCLARKKERKKESQHHQDAGTTDIS